MLVITEIIRQCGKRRPGFYITAGTEGSEDGTLQRFYLCTPPIPYPVNVHRSFRLIYGSAVLGREPMDGWWAGSSKDTEEKKSADQWSLETFGMTDTARLSIGECKDAKTIAEAQAILTDKVKWNDRLVGYFRSLGELRVAELPKCAGHYDLLQKNLLAYSQTHNVGNLMGAVGAIWRLFNDTPPSKKKEVTWVLSSMLILMGLPEDGKHMLYSTIE